MNVAMHISNGIISGPVSIAYGLIAAALLALCLAKAREDLNDRLAPMAGLVAAFIFAVQMLNFPVLPGVSGHLLGGALAAALVGPWVGALCVAVVLIVQALVFADGGLTALGLNISNMALLGTAVGYLAVVGLLKLLPRTSNGVSVAVFLASIVSVVLASMGFVGQYALGGAELTIGYGQIAGLLGGVHALIGVGEGLIAAVTVATVARVRPDLVYALRGQALTTESPTQRSPKRLLLAGLGAAVVLAGGVSYLASSAPDGLDAATLDGCTVNDAGEITGGTCVAQTAKDHELAGGWLSDYGLKDIDGTTGVAGVIGVLVVFVVGFVIFKAARRRVKV